MIHNKINISHFTVEQRKKATLIITSVIDSFLIGCKESDIDIPLPNPFINDELVLHIETEVEEILFEAIKDSILESIEGSDKLYIEHELSMQPLTSDILKWFKSVLEMHVNLKHIEIHSPYYNELLEYILKKTFIRGF